MLSKVFVRSLISIIPEKRAAVVTLSPDSPSPIKITVFNAWLKPLDVSLLTYGNVNLQGDETRINIPQQELNPYNNGLEIRSRDEISIDAASYLVLSATLKSVRTRWECIVRKVLN